MFHNANSILTAKLQERESKVGLQVQLNDYEVAAEQIGDIVERRTKRRTRGCQQKGRAADRSTPLEVTEDVEERRRPFLWESGSRRRSTLVGPMFRAAAGGGGDAERRGRRLTEHRRRSTLLLGLFSEEQERLRELAQRALEEERRGQHARPPAFDAELFYTVYMEREDGNFALFNYVLEQSRMIEETTKDLEQLRQSIDEEKAATERRLSRERARDLELKRQHTVQSSGKLQTDVEEYRRILSLVKSGHDRCPCPRQHLAGPSEPAGSPALTITALQHNKPAVVMDCTCQPYD
ncbi:uncharacterized protein LOC134022779 [Osmerus eperlanus]|uniref:uncharacterized protein LOC134022779 n=1 Tax=Osmerus eperlanus TaxID=29151 RepID=UPI002E10E9A1